VKVYKHVCPQPNIGDELNDWFWHEILGDVALEFEPDSILVGIGTVLSDKLPDAKHYHVIGSGTGYGELSKLNNENTTFHFVRGPLTAEKLNLSNEQYITDPGILIADLRPVEVSKKKGIAFMPHVGIDSIEYKVLVESMGWTYISPSSSEHEVLSAIASASLLVTSAMHGAIIADSYRVPWIPIITSSEILPFKWRDWCLTMQLKFEAHEIPPLWHVEGSTGAKIKNKIKSIYIQKRLKKIAKSVIPTISNDAVFAENKRLLHEKFIQIKTKFLESK
jgi:succinoglycan biosynthesis protein ExoV